MVFVPISGIELLGISQVMRVLKVSLVMATQASWQNILELKSTWGNECVLAAKVWVCGGELSQNKTMENSPSPENSSPSCKVKLQRENLFPFDAYSKCQS